MYDDCVFMLYYKYLNVGMEVKMLITVPDYYKEFICIADQCEDSCCAGWQIVIDKKALSKYKKTTGSYRNVLMKKINWKEGTFKQDSSKRCAFLRNDNLCEMYRELGPDSLCRTCRLYPRHMEEFEGVREITLSVSCPEVARILMNRKDIVTFKTVEIEKDESYEEFDDFLFSLLLDVREAMIAILQNRKLPISVREGLIYGMGRDIQRRINHKQLFDGYHVIEKYEKIEAQDYVRSRLEHNQCFVNKRYMFIKSMFHKMQKLELLKEDWFVLCKEVQNTLYASKDAFAYDEISTEFYEWMKEQYPDWEIQKEQLLVYFIFTYLCGAVYDGDILKKVQMALISVDMIEEFLKVYWLRNEKTLDVKDVIEVVYRYSREVEHSEVNLKRMEQMMPVTHAKFC